MEQILILATGVVAGFAAALVGGAGVFTLPALMLVGLTPQMAIATTKFASLAFWVTALYKYNKSDKVSWRLVLPICVIGGLGGFLGTKIVLGIPVETMKLLTTVLILMTLPLVVMKKDLGVVARATTPGRKAAGYAIYFLIALYSGFLGAGGGIMASLAYVTFFGLTLTESRATDSLPRLVMSLASLLAFSFGDMVDVGYGLWLMAGMVAGGWLGAHAAIKKGDVWVRRIFLIGTVGMAGALLWDLV